MKARSYKSKYAEARVDIEPGEKGKTVFLPEIAMAVGEEEKPLTEAAFRRELKRLDHWIDQTLLWLDKYHT